MRHGTSYAYTKGCRCEPCTTQNRERVTAWRAKNRPVETTRPQPKREPKRAHPTVRRPDPDAHDRDTLSTLSAGEWAKARGYDPTTRTYAA
jgi:hypothetical protein